MTRNSDVPATGFHTTNGRDGEVRRVVAGNLTIWNAEGLRRTLLQGRSSAAATTIDFGGEETIDVAGVQLLIAACRATRGGNEGRIVVADPPEKIFHWLKRAGLAIGNGEVRPDDAE